MKKMSLSEVMETMEQETTNYGFRGASQHDLEIVKSGQTYLEPSTDMFDGNFSDEKLDGTCAIQINEYMDLDELAEAYEYTKKMYADNPDEIVLFISGGCQEYGNDEDEVILRDEFESGAKVIAQVVA